MRTALWVGPSCPQDPTHGVLLAWPGSYTAWMCPHRRHVGRQFFDSDLQVVARSDQPVSPLRLRSPGDGLPAVEPDAPGSPPPPQRGAVSERSKARSRRRRAP